jgi:hypothetical protein
LEKLEAKLEHVVPPAAADTTTDVGILEGKPTSMEALPEAEKELEAMPNAHALFFNGTFITASDSSSWLPTWTRTCPSTCPFDPGKSYPFDPGIDDYLRSLLDFASSPRSRKLITANGFANTAIITSDTDDGSNPRNWAWSPWSNPSEPCVPYCDFAWSNFGVSNIAEFTNSSSNANDVVDNTACFDYNCQNEWHLPPWPDDNELAGAWFPPPKADAWPDDD